MVAGASPVLRLTACKRFASPRPQSIPYFSSTRSACVLGSDGFHPPDWNELTTATPELLADGLRLIRGGEFFDAHEVLEDAWRAAEPGERDFFQGLVHVAVAWYQAGRGNRVGCERQLEKATRRLGPYAPAHRDVDVAAILAQLRAAETVVAEGSLELEVVRV